MVSSQALGLLTILFVGSESTIKRMNFWELNRKVACDVVSSTWCSFLDFLCTPLYTSVCRRRRRAILDGSEIEKFDKMGKLYTLPQSFDDYHPENETISMDKFIVGVQKALPAHLHHYAVLAETFDKADVNDDGLLDEAEFQKGPWMVTEEELIEMKYKLIEDGFGK